MVPHLEWAQLPAGRILYWVADADGQPTAFRIGADLLDDDEGRRLLAELGAQRHSPK
jgi:hypothetical protein